MLQYFLYGLLISNSFAFLYTSEHRNIQPVTTRKHISARHLTSVYSNNGDAQSGPNACLMGYISPGQEQELSRILQDVGYKKVFLDADVSNNSDGAPLFKYKYVKASGMLKLVDDSKTSNDRYEQPPKYIPVQSGEENVLVANGWSFLDPDESEPVSAFDIDAANAEGQYKPKWGTSATDDATAQNNMSSIGFNLKLMSSNEILSGASNLQSISRRVLLKGGTDEPNIKTTNNGYDFSGPFDKFQRGLFTCAIGGNPLFTTNDLSALTASSGWLSFFRPLSEDHVRLVYAEKESMDQRVEVVDSKTNCHLGHFFKEGGFCINASALNFFPCDGSSSHSDESWDQGSHPISWRLLDREIDDSSYLGSPISKEILREVLGRNVESRTVLLGLGCFWHSEFALRRLPGIIETKVGYAGGSYTSPTYEDVCKKDTKHAEVVKVVFDPKVCDPRKLIDCFLAMHDPTVIRAHGKRAIGTGQYRSCIFPIEPDVERIALDAITDCRKQLAKVLSTEVKLMSLDSFWMAEDRHQLHDQRVKKRSGDDIVTLSETDWLLKYGRRSSSIFGSSATINIDVDDSDDDGMARMMI